MSKLTARLAADQLVGRPALVAPHYVAQGVKTGSEVTSESLQTKTITISQSAMFSDIQEIANAVHADEIAATGDRNRLLASTYGFDQVDDGKPFVFSNGYALIPIHGLLINRFSYGWGFVTGYNFIRNQVSAALGDDDVEAIIFDVNSNGGTVAGCQETADLMWEGNAANGGKPMIAVVDANCHSAAYFLTSQCDHVAITPSGSAANIGVLMTHWDISEMMSEAGVKVSFIIAGAHKVDGNPYEPLSDDVRAEFQADVDATYDVFVAAVVRGRGMDDQAVRDTEARCYGAADALALGLVDAIQNPSDAVEAYFNPTDDETDDSGGDDPDADPPDQQESKMTVRPTTATPAKPGVTATAPVSEVTSDQVANDARVAERTRIRGITTHAEATGREALANYLAHDTDMDIDMAVGILSASPKNVAVAAAAAPVTTTDQGTSPTAAVTVATEANHFETAMNNGSHPNVGASAGGGGSEEDLSKLTPAARILRSQSKATGFKPKSATAH